MLEDLDNRVSSYLFYVKVCTFTHLEQGIISLLTVNKIGNDKVTIQHDMIASVSFM
jgi:hypothetical protein